MPCSDSNAWAKDLAREGKEKLAKELVNVSSFLCAICRILEKNGKIGLLIFVPGLVTWYADHKEHDAKTKTN